MLDANTLSDVSATQGVLSAPQGEQAGTGLTTPNVSPGTNEQASTTPAIDWNTVDWEKADVKNIEKIPSVRKMQASLRRQASEATRELQLQLTTLQRQNEYMQQVLQGQIPEAATHINQMKTATELEQLRSQLTERQKGDEKTQVLRHLQETHGLPPDFLDDVESPFDAYERIIEYNKTKAGSLESQVAELTRKVTAVASARTDPAANPQLGSAPNTSYQDQYDQLMREYKGDKASQLRRKAEAEGVELDTMRWRNARPS